MKILQDNNRDIYFIAIIPPRLLREQIRAIKDLSAYRMTAGCLRDISVPALVVVASKDRFHSHDEGMEIARQISGAGYIDMVDNRRTHSAETGRRISDFISSPAQKQSQEGQPWRDIS